MNRFMGMMPSSEIALTKTYVDSLGMKSHIDAGEHGWTIRYADHSTEYADVDDTPENNLNAALKQLKTHLTVTEYEGNTECEEACEE